MDDVAQRIAAILANRRNQLPQVQAEISQWHRLDHELVSLSKAVADFSAHPKTPAEVRDELSRLPFAQLRSDIETAVSMLRTVEARFSRGTINIGVSGVARVGKSTLLQAISGLTDQQIPVGKGLPVTAVRSSIYHSPTHRRARLLMHSFESFRDEVLKPYFDTLGMTSHLPESAATFSGLRLPLREADLPKEWQTPECGTLLVRLRKMQETFPRYVDHLTGGETVVGLDGLRQYVAYPATDADSPLHLAVKAVTIECPFPRVQVESLGIIDLPGLGEVAAELDSHHVDGLKNNVDLVLLIKRPLEGMAYWEKRDVNTANLLDKARGLVARRKDFVFILVNTGGADADLTSAVKKDLLEKANEGEDGRNYQVLEANAAEQKAVEECVLGPILKHLAQRLPAMDQQVLEGTRKQFATAASHITSVAGDISRSLKGVVIAGTDAQGELDERTRRLREDLAVRLSALVEKHFKLARSQDEDPAYVEAVTKAHQSITDWITGGFGRGREAWCEAAFKDFAVQRSSAPFATNQLNAIRVEISRRFSMLDDFCHSRVDALLRSVSSALREHTGTLIAQDVSDGMPAIDSLLRLSSDSDQPCEAFRSALADLAKLNLEYRTHLHPRVRASLDRLCMQDIGGDGQIEQKDRMAVALTASGAEELFESISQYARQAAFQTKKALMDQAVTPALVLHAAVEQFEDALIRSASSEQDFRRIGRLYRDEIWPDVFKGIAEDNARCERIRKSLNAVNSQLTEIAAGASR
jgi:hypothetical protein